MSAEVAE